MTSTSGTWQQNAFQKDWTGDKAMRYFQEVNLGDVLLTGQRVTVTALPGLGWAPAPWAGLGAAGQGHKEPSMSPRAATVTHPASEGLHLQMLTPV